MHLCYGCAADPPCSTCAKARIRAEQLGYCPCKDQYRATVFRTVKGRSTVWCIRCHGFVKKLDETIDLPRRKRAWLKHMRAKR